MLHYLKQLVCSCMTAVKVATRDSGRGQNSEEEEEGGQQKPLSVEANGDWVF